ncbi:hypothetical protein GN958_ATG21858, partial [Phytophthora infestans]
RYEDYLKRTNPAAALAAATQNAPAPEATTTETGAVGGFGAQPAASSAFGATGGFGNTQPSALATTSTTTGSFGGFESQPNAPATSGDLFGSSASRPATGGFGAPATSSAFHAVPAASSAFGAPATGGGFGYTTGEFGSGFALLQHQGHILRYSTFKPFALLLYLPQDVARRLSKASYYLYLYNNVELEVVRGILLTSIHCDYKER